MVYLNVNKTIEAPHFSIHSLKNQVMDFPRCLSQKLGKPITLKTAMNGWRGHHSPDSFCSNSCSSLLLTVKGSAQLWNTCSTVFYNGTSCMIVLLYRHKSLWSSEVFSYTCTKNFMLKRMQFKRFFFSLKKYINSLLFRIRNIMRSTKTAAYNIINTSLFSL